MKIIIFCLSGVGNTILFTPTLKELCANLPNAKITLLVAKQPFAEPVKGSDLVENIVVFEQNGLWSKLALLWKLRSSKYDYSITAFPSNRWQHNLFAFLVGAKTRITHSYQVAKLRTLSFLQNKKVSAIEGIHDVEQNLRLLEPLRIEKNAPVLEPFFYLLDEDKEFAKEFWNKNALRGEFVVGIHPGGDRRYAYKRWSKESFVHLIEKLVNEKRAKILLFAGPDEELFVEDIKEQLSKSERVYLIRRTGLKKVAALISECSCFICNDSGLGHVAAALRVKTLSIMGPTIHTRISPYGKRANFVRTGIECSPCLKYPFQATNSRIKCDKNMKCMRELQVDTVFKAIETLLENLPSPISKQ